MKNHQRYSILWPAQVLVAARQKKNDDCLLAETQLRSNSARNMYKSVHDVY